MAPKIDPAPWTDVFGVLASVTKAVSALRVPIEGAIEALNQILRYTEVSEFECLLSMSLYDCDMQQVKNNKEESVALAEHAREMTLQVVDALKGRNDLDSLKPSIEDFFKSVDLSQTLYVNVTGVVEL
jgi:hypothetical protein